jgi:hypothetical protein
MCRSQVVAWGVPKPQLRLCTGWEGPSPNNTTLATGNRTHPLHNSSNKNEFGLQVSQGVCAACVQHHAALDRAQPTLSTANKDSQQLLGRRRLSTQGALRLGNDPGQDTGPAKEVAARGGRCVLQCTEAEGTPTARGASVTAATTRADTRATGKRVVRGWARKTMYEWAGVCMGVCVGGEACLGTRRWGAACCQPEQWSYPDAALDAEGGLPTPGTTRTGLLAASRDTARRTSVLAPARTAHNTYLGHAWG